jgi:hypothetical protein
MATYRFPQFSTDLIDPTFEAVSADYVVGASDVQIRATLQTADSKLYGVELGTMANTATWGDAEVMASATSALETYRID